MIDAECSSTSEGHGTSFRDPRELGALGLRGMAHYDLICACFARGLKLIGQSGFFGVKLLAKAIEVGAGTAGGGVWGGGAASGETGPRPLRWVTVTRTGGGAGRIWWALSAISRGCHLLRRPHVSHVGGDLRHAALREASTSFA